MSLGSALSCSLRTYNIQKNSNQFDRLGFKRLASALVWYVKKAVTLSLRAAIYRKYSESHLSIE